MGLRLGPGVVLVKTHALLPEEAQTCSRVTLLVWAEAHGKPHPLMQMLAYSVGRREFGVLGWIIWGNP